MKTTQRPRQTTAAQKTQAAQQSVISQRVITAKTLDKQRGQLRMPSKLTVVPILPSLPDNYDPAAAWARYWAEKEAAEKEADGAIAL